MRIIGQLIPHWKRNWLIQVRQWMQSTSALRSGITVASEVQPRRGYCWLKTFPNTPQKRLVIKSALQFLKARAWAQLQIKTVKALKTTCSSDFIQTNEVHCGDKTPLLSSSPVYRGWKMNFYSRFLRLSVFPWCMDNQQIVTVVVGVIRKI